MTMNPYTVLAKAMLKASERRYQTMKDIEDIYRIVKGNIEFPLRFKYNYKDFAREQRIKQETRDKDRSDSSEVGVI